MGLLDRLRRRPAPIEHHRLSSSGPRALVAAAARVDVTDRAEGARLAPRQAWQADAWVYRDAIGEVRYGIDWLASVMSRLRLFVAVVTDPALPPIDVIDATSPQGSDDDPQPPLVTDLSPQLVQDAIDALAMLAGGGIGHAALLRPLTVNFEVAGECYLVGWDDPLTGQQIWQIRSIEELERTRDGRWILRDAPVAGTATPTGGMQLPPDAYVARLWRPHPRWSGLADSPMKGVLDPCEGLLLKARKGRVRDRARLSRGLLYVAEELEFEDEEGQPTGFQSRLTAAMVSAVSDESSASSIAPTVIRGPSELTDPIRHIDVVDKQDEARDSDEALKLLARIVRGLDFPPEVVEGLGDVKFANAIAIDSTSFRYHVEPKAQGHSDALSVGYLWPYLEALGHDPEQVRRLVIWYDPSDVVSNPNRLPDALNLHERKAISDEALRDAGGFSEADAPSEEELLMRLVFQQRTLPPGLDWAMIAILAERAGIDLPAPPADPAQPAVGPGGDPAAAPADQPPDAVAASAAAVRAPAPFTDRALQLDLDLRGRVEAACDAAMRRALDRAGARLVSKVKPSHPFRQHIAGVPGSRVAAALGPERIASLGLTDEQLLTGAFDDVAALFRAWTTATFEQGLQAACDLIGVRYFPPDQTGLTAAAAHPDLAPPFSDLPLGGIDQVAARARFTADLTAAADRLVDDLTATARGQLYSPPTIPGQGEYDPNLTVSPSTVRAALARAGGADSDPLFSGLTDLGQPANPSDGDPGMVATGRTIRSALTVAGVAQYAYRWTWGGSPRPFPPHRDLDGQVFSDQTDQALSVADEHRSWLPATSYRPGDHKGCRCATAYLLDDPFEGMDPQETRQVRAAQQTRDARGRFIAVNAA